MNSPYPTPQQGTAAEKKSFKRWIPAIARILLGLPLLVFGLNMFFHFIPEPKTAIPEGAMAFVGALVQSGS